uniref:Consomatin Nc1 n=1 Tax=Conus neocostatus TaxID=2840447 RepID=CSST1_CONNO|nr:RecName: Full=Consomatin Nc1; Short=ConSST Nc1; AltName: Full=Somatostatin-related peptide; Short=SSRP; Flags: Precursor [Conus neocostatus]UUS55768.1 consomatin Nc1 [Conus neocostatus]
MQTAYWVMVMVMVWITAPLSEGGKPNDVIRGLVPDDLTPQLILRSLISRRRSDKDVGKRMECYWKSCSRPLSRRHDLG